MKTKALQVKIAERSTDSLWSWVVCTSSFFIQFLVCGVHNSFGTFFVALLNKFGRSEAETVWVGAVAIGITYLCGPFSTYLCRRFGCRIVACTGSVLLAISAFLTSIASEIIWMYFTFGVLNGLASSMLYFSSLVALIDYFHHHLATANGIAVSGVGVGTLIINILTQALISRYGLNITFRALAGLSAISFVAGLAYAPISSTKDSTFKESILDLPFTHPEKKDTLCGRPKKTFLKKCLRLFKLGKHWQNKGFVVWTIAMSLIMFVCYVPLVYLVRVAEDVGVPPSKGGFLIGIMAISQTVGKLIFGRIANLKCANRLKMAQVALLFIAVSTCLVPLARSYSALVAYSVVLGFSDGCYVVLIGLITHDIVGKELMAGAVGSVYFMISIPMTMGPPVAGMFYDHLGNYNAVFFLSGALVCTGICVMSLIPYVTPPILTKLDLHKQDLIPSENTTFRGFEKGKRFDLSCIDEQNLADLFGKSGADILLKRNRSLLDGSLTDSQRSSFVLFTIISEENQRDISAYSSYQDLAVNCDVTPSFSSSLRRFFHESHTSLFSLNQSVAEVSHLEAIPEIVGARHESDVLIHREVTLETLDEVSERQQNISAEEEAMRKTDTEKMVSKDVIDNVNCSQETVTKERELLNPKLDGGEAEEGVDNAVPSLSDSDWRSSLSCDYRKSSSQFSTGTADSGFEDYKLDFLNEGNGISSDSIYNTAVSDNGSNASLVVNKSLSRNLANHSYSFNDVSLLSEARGSHDSPQRKGVLSGFPVNTSPGSIDSCMYEEEVYHQVVISPLPETHNDINEAESEVILNNNGMKVEETDL